MQEVAKNFLKGLSPFSKWWSSTSSCYILPAHDTSCLWSRVCVLVPEGSELEQHPPIWCTTVQQKMTVDKHTADITTIIVG